MRHYEIQETIAHCEESYRFPAADTFKEVLPRPAERAQRAFSMH
jgi:hypothetical protein